MTQVHILFGKAFYEAAEVIKVFHDLEQANTVARSLNEHAKNQPTHSTYITNIEDNGQWQQYENAKSEWLSNRPYPELVDEFNHGYFDGGYFVNSFEVI